MGEVRTAIFRGGEVVEHVSIDVNAPEPEDSARVWIEVLDPGDHDLALLQERFKLHQLAVKDSMSPIQAPKLDIYDDQLFIVLKSARLKNDEIRYSEVNAFVSARRIITVHRGEDVDDADAHRKLRYGPRSARPDFILHAIMDLMVEKYFPVVQMIEDEVLSMEQSLLDAFLDHEEVNRLFRLRREAIQLQHVLTRMSDVCGKLTNLDVPCISAEAKPYFRDVHDQLVRLDGMIGGLIDVIRAVFDASSLLEQQRQGAATRKLAGWAAIVGAPSAIAGINFPNVPALHEPYGYAVLVAVMVALCVGLYLRFKRLRWL